MGTNDSKRTSKSLIPPEVLLAGSVHEDEQSKAESVEISTPKKIINTKLTDNNTKKEILRTPDSLNAIDLNIVNLESTSDIRIDDRARSSPSIRAFENEEEMIRRTASTSNITKAEDPEDRLGQGRQYSLDLGPIQDHVIVEIEQQRTRKENEKKFKIIVGLIVFASLFTVTFFMIAWEMGYLNTSNNFSTPVFY